MKRRRLTHIVLAGAVTAALGASGVYIAGASADETTVAGRLQAESYAAQSGAQTEGTGDADGGKNVGWLADGDWLRFDGVAVTGTALSARIASDNSAGGSVELHLGSQTGTLLATFPVARTGGWQKWTTVTATAKSVPAGAQTVFAVMKSAQKSDFVNLNWFTLGGAAAPAPAPSVPTGDGWVPVDKAKWDKQLAEYNATVAKPVPAGNVRVPEFNASCKVSHRLSDDPIVFPGMAGASHLHTFMGNKSTSAASTNASLFAGLETSCEPKEDRSAYWIPTLLENGKPVDPHGVTVYYGSRLKDPTKTVPFPEGFRMITGDAKKQVATGKGAPAQFWCAGAGGETGRSADGNWPVCAKTAELTYQLTFPDCWDGVHLDSPDHKSHVGPTGPDGTCASGRFPVAIPSISFVIGYPTSGSSAGFQLSSGMASSMHGDFMNAWETKPLAQRVRNCITQKAKCDSFGNF
ncbi:DUF1996 domain-containing protein [Nucisporomicrobium flavum]|uniref:DUF1996 domain-containing protein n=1 Tax=Nucisporomicrobium flavum TaxID=2785915 RepID=UPI0018F64E77|nr:DUF1996 domain-containing protein [Nucisporomicrobium flavum]